MEGMPEVEGGFISPWVVQCPQVPQMHHADALLFDVQNLEVVEVQTGMADGTRCIGSDVRVSFH